MFSDRTNQRTRGCPFRVLRTPGLRHSAAADVYVEQRPTCVAGLPVPPGRRHRKRALHVTAVLFAMPRYSLNRHSQANSHHVHSHFTAADGACAAIRTRNPQRLRRWKSLMLRRDGSTRGNSCRPTAPAASRFGSTVVCPRSRRMPKHLHDETPGVINAAMRSRA
jgi:hypothetical protein